MPPYPPQPPPRPIDDPQQEMLRRVAEARRGVNSSDYGGDALSTVQKWETLTSGMSPEQKQAFVDFLNGLPKSVPLDLGGLRG